MVTITRSLVRQLRSIYRRVGIKPTVHHPTYLALETNASGLTIRARAPEIMVEYHQPGDMSAEHLLVPIEILADFEGAKPDPVVLERHGTDKVTATWTDRSIPQLVEYQLANGNDIPQFPEPPETLIENAPELWQALRDASQSTDSASSRYALGYIQLRGSVGRVAATDGRQIFMQTGFQFPWDDDALILGSSLFVSRELPHGQPVRVGRSGDWITLVLGPWTFRFCTPKEARYPKLDDIMMAASASVTRLQIAPVDAQFLIESLPRLPNHDPAHEPVTLDLNGKVVLRANSGTDTPPTELIATNSRVIGETMLLETNRKFLVRALRLGFREIGFKAPECPAFCINGDRKYLWALLGPAGAIRASEDATRIESPSASGGLQVSSHSHSRRLRTMSHTNTEGTLSAAAAVSETKTKSRRPKPSTPTSSIEQVVVLRAALREAVNQSNELIRALKRQKKQSKLVASTLASLKELEKVAA